MWSGNQIAGSAVFVLYCAGPAQVSAAQQAPQAQAAAEAPMVTAPDADLIWQEENVSMVC